MLIYAFRRLGLAMLILVTSITLLFGALKLIPGDPATIMLGARATPELKAAISEELGLDDPVPVQIVHFFGRLLQGDLGTDLWTKRPVADLVLEGLPHTLALIGADRKSVV